MEKSRRRFLEALDGKQPDCVPIFDFLFSQKLFEEVIGRRPEVYNAEDAVDLTIQLGLDAVFIPFGGYAGFEAEYISEHTYKDEWGTTYKTDRTASWPIDAPLDFPIKTREDLKNYSFPDPYLPGRADEIDTAVKKAGKEIAILGGALGPFTAAWSLTGLDHISVLFYDDPAMVKEVLRKCTDFFIEAGKIMVNNGVDALILADDLGFVSGPLMTPGQFKEFILPEFTRQAQAFRQLGVPVLMHNDGDIMLFLDELVQTGIHAYHPVERQAGMDLQLVKEKFGNTIALVGNVNNKTTMVFGTTEDVRKEVAECLLIAAPGGGYVMSSDHSFHQDIPLKNILTMIETTRRYGCYPLPVEDLQRFRNEKSGQEEKSERTGKSFKSHSPGRNRPDPRM